MSLYTLPFNKVFSLSLSLSVCLSLSLSQSPIPQPEPPHPFSLLSFYCFCLSIFLCVRESLCSGEAETELRPAGGEASGFHRCLRLALRPLGGEASGLQPSGIDSPTLFPLLSPPSLGRPSPSCRPSA